MKYVMIQQHLINLNKAMSNGNFQKATTAANGILQHYDIRVPQNTNAATRISWAMRIKTARNKKINLMLMPVNTRNKIVKQ